MSKQAKKYQTQWTTQFYAAAELTRRGYLVSLTFGNAPSTDILAATPNKDSFKVEVKGLSTNNWWLIDRPASTQNSFYILIYLPKRFLKPKFCILTADEVVREIDHAKNSYLKRGKRWDETMEGIPFKSAFKYQNKWNKLPKVNS